MKKLIGALWLAYDREFGCEAKDIRLNEYWDQENPEFPAVSVSIYRKEDTGRSHDIIVTSGMSLTPMNFGDDYQGERFSTELIMYVKNADKDDIHWMFWLASLPFMDNFVLGFGHTVNVGRPLYKDSSLCQFLFLNTLIKNDAIALDGFKEFPYPIELLWVVPITPSEHSLKQTKGVNTLLDLFEEHKHPITLNKARKSYVQNA